MEIYTDDLCLVVTVNLFSCDIEYSVVLLVCSFMRKTCFLYCFSLKNMLEINIKYSRKERSGERVYHIQQ